MNYSDVNIHNLSNQPLEYVIILILLCMHTFFLNSLWTQHPADKPLTTFKFLYAL